MTAAPSNGEIVNKIYDGMEAGYYEKDKLEQRDLDYIARASMLASSNMNGDTGRVELSARQVQLLFSAALDRSYDCLHPETRIMIQDMDWREGYGEIYKPMGQQTPGDRSYYQDFQDKG